MNCLRTKARQRGFASAEIHGKQKWTIDFASHVVRCMPRRKKFIRARAFFFFFFGLTMERTWDFSSIFITRARIIFFSKKFIKESLLSVQI